MRIVKSELEAVAVKPSQYPEANCDEIAFAGRSNVGKSSLLNLLTNRKKLARVSGSPGKTRTINFYRINDEFRIVDLPGYGYAKLSRSETEKWGDMMDAYLSQRKGLRKVVQLVDIRHEPSALDVQMYDYLRYYGLDGLVVATKADKISRNQQQKSIQLIRKTLGMKKDDRVIPVSALKRTGQDQLLAAIEKILNKEDNKADSMEDNTETKKDSEQGGSVE
jgi:GTP-binding protein